MVLASFLNYFAVWGSLYTFGLFLKPLAEEFGWSRAVTSGAYSLNTVLLGLLSIPAGLLADRYGPRLVLAVSTLVAGLGYFLMFWLSGLWQLYLFFGVMVALGGASAVAPLAALSHWFPRGRGMAMGIVLSGVGVGQTILAPVMSLLIGNYDWRLAYMVLGGVVWLCALGPSLLFRLPKKADSATPASFSSGGMTLTEAARTRPFWLLQSIWILSALPSTLLLVHIIPYATDRGYTAEAAALIMTIIGVVGIAGRLGMGFVSDRVRNTSAIFIICMLMQTAALFWLLWAKQLGAFYVIGALFIVGYGGRDVIILKAMPDIFGLRALSAILAALNLGWFVGAAVGAPLGGHVFDVTGGYSWAFLVGGLAFVLATILSLPLLSRLKGVKGVKR